MQLSIFAPDRTLLVDEEVTEVTLYGSEGQIEILPGHSDFLGTLETGMFSFNSKTGTEARNFGVISTGFVEVDSNKVTVVAETLEMRDEIDLERAVQAQRVAEEAFRKEGFDMHQFRKYELKLQRALIRQQVAKMK